MSEKYIIWKLFRELFLQNDFAYLLLEKGEEREEEKGEKH